MSLAGIPLIDGILKHAHELADEVLRLTNRCPAEIDITLHRDVFWRVQHEAVARKLIDVCETDRGRFSIPTGRAVVTVRMDRTR